MIRGGLLSRPACRRVDDPQLVAGDTQCLAESGIECAHVGIGPFDVIAARAFIAQAEDLPKVVTSGAVRIDQYAVGIEVSVLEKHFLALACRDVVLVDQ